MGKSFSNYLMVGSNQMMLNFNNIKLQFKKRLLVSAIILAMPALSSAAWEEYPQDKTIAAYAANYNFCDAKVLAAFWGESIFEAKLSIGNKILNLGATTADATLTAARSTAISSENELPCIYSDGGYDYKDSAALANYWDMDLSETKSKMSFLHVTGASDIVRATLADIR